MIFIIKMFPACLKLIISISLMLKCCNAAEISRQPTEFDNANNSTATNKLMFNGVGDQKCSTSTDNGKAAIKFKLPFMDMEIENQRNVHIVQEPIKNQLFALHGNELYEIFVSSKERRMSLVGLLNGSVKKMELLGFQVISWHDSLIFVVAVVDYLEVYQISQSTITQRAQIAENPTKAAAPQFEAIQELTLPGKYQKIFLTAPAEERVMLIVAVNFTKVHAKLRTLEWLNTYFEPIEDLTVPSMQILQQIGNNTKYIVTGRTIRHQARTILTIYEIKQPTLNLRNCQTLTVNSRVVHAVTWQGVNYIIACTINQKKCNSFRMSDGQFNVYKQRQSQELTFDKFVAGTGILVGARQNEVRVFTNGQMNCYGSFTTNETDVTSIFTYKNEDDELFVLLNYKRTYNTLLRTLQIETAGDAEMGAKASSDDMDDLTDVRRHQHMFEETVGKLQSLLLKRRSMNEFLRRATNLIAPKPISLKVNNTVHLYGGKVDVVQVVGRDLRSPMQLMKRLEKMAQKYRRTRFAREIERNKNLLYEEPLRLKVKKMQVKNLIYDADVLEGFNLNNLTRPLPILSISPKLRTEVLHTQQLLTRKNYNSARFESNMENSTGASSAETTKTQKLQIKRINNILWSEFLENVFLRNRDEKIAGRLIMQAPVNVTNLWTPILNGLVVQQLFNLKQPQLISSDILISRFFITDLEASTVNGLNFAEDIVFSGRNDFVETPVKFHQLSISGDLLLSDNSSKFRSMELPKTALEQFYTGTVIINGSLTVNQLKRDNIVDTQILIDGVNFTINYIKNHYFLKYTQQTFNTTVVFGNTKLTAPALNTNFLNNQPINDHLLRSTQPNPVIPLFLVFMLANVNGSVICNGYRSNVLDLQKNAVRHGDVANVTAIKIFEAPLTIDNLMTLNLNELPVQNLVLKAELKHEFDFSGAKTFEQLLVTNDVNIKKALNATHLNNLPLRELLNYDYYMHSLYLPHKLEASDIVFHRINGIGFDTVFAKLNTKGEHLLLHKDLIIEGNVKFVENLATKNINDIKLSDYLDNLVRIGEDTVIHGQKRFLNELTITKALNTTSVNNIDMQEVFENILLQSKPQIITGFYTFDKLKANNFDVTVINDVPASAFIDTRVAAIIIDSDIVVPRVTVRRDLTGTLAQQFQFENLAVRINALTAKKWRNLVVHGNATWMPIENYAKTVHEQMQYLQKNAIKRTGDNIITGDVKLRYPIISNMFTKTTFPIDIDLEFIAKDCLLKNSSVSQIVFAEKSFRNPIQMQNLASNTVLQVPLVNNIDISRFNISLYRLSSGQPIIGPLIFMNTPTFDKVTLFGTINGIHMAQIFQITNNNSLPAVQIPILVIYNSLQVDDVNGMNLNYLLENRVKKNGTATEVFGFLTFENLAFNKEVSVQSINGIEVDNLVFKKHNRMQSITGAKTIEGNLELGGPAHVMYLNGKHLIDNYQQSIFKNQNQRFESLTLNGVTFDGGLVLPVNSETDTHKDRAVENEVILPNLPAMENKFNDIEKQLEVLKKDKTQLMYLEFDFDTDILWQKANETINQSYLFETKRLSKCQRQMLHVQYAKFHNRLFLSNFTTNLLTTQVDNFNIKAENYCIKKYRKVKSKISITDGNTTKIFGMKNCIENIEIFDYNQSDTFVLLHAVDFTGNRSEVRILKIDNNTHEMRDWQALKTGIDKNMRLFKLKNSTVLISNGLVKKRPIVAIYHFDKKALKFHLKQIIEGEYDLYEMSVVEPKTGKYLLILGCRQCQRLHIYDNKVTENDGKYEIFQSLKLPILVDKLQTFQMSDNRVYLLVLSSHEQNYYHLYKYSYIEGWVEITYGYFPNIKLAVLLNGKQLTEIGDNLILLLCNAVKCGLVKAFVKY